MGFDGRALEEEIRTARGLVTVDGIVALDREERPGFAVKSAAELLLPSAALRERFPDGRATLEEANQVADELAVSWAVLNHQLENHRIAEIIPS